MLVTGALYCNAIFAGNETGTVRMEHGQWASDSTSAGETFFYLDGGARNNPPACATYANGERWVFSNDQPAASFQHSILLAAITSGKRVKVEGFGSCDVHGNTETARNITLLNDR